MGKVLTTIEWLSSKRTTLMIISGPILLLVIAASIWLSSSIGILVFACLLLAVAIGPFLGRYWCSWLCPRGSFLEYYLNKVSAGRPFPAVFKQAYFLAFMVALFLVVLAGSIYSLQVEYPLLAALGITMTRLLVVTTIVAVILGLIYAPRAWCVICPGATMAKLVAGSRVKGPQLFHQGECCTGCHTCAEYCPFQIDGSTRGAITDTDCLKCFECVKHCPTHSLLFK